MADYAAAESHYLSDERLDALDRREVRRSVYFWQSVCLVSCRAPDQVEPGDELLRLG